MLSRLIADRLRQELAQVPAIVLTGASQVGKTTLVGMLATKPLPKGVDSVYLDLESQEDLRKLNDPGSFLRTHRDKLVILDEIQHSPNLFKILRDLIDANRQRGRKSAQFLLLGSASLNLLHQSSRHLIGRSRHIELSGLNVLETIHDANGLQALWLRGGYPESYLASGDGTAMKRLEQLIRDCLERHVPQLGFHVPAARLRRLWTMLAYLQGEQVNLSRLAENLEVDGKTVGRYLDILTDMLLVRRLEPWRGVANRVADKFSTSTNVAQKAVANTKRLVKSPRYYIRNSGILHRLLGIDSHDALLSHPELSNSWEAFVIENIHSVLPRWAETWFYRTSAGAEIDLVIKMRKSEIWAVDIKYGVAPKPGKHYSRTCEDVGAARKFIVHGGNDDFLAGNEIQFISLPKLMKLIYTS